MKRKKKHSNKYISKKDYNSTIVLSNEDVINDYSHLAKLKVSESTRDWMEVIMKRTLKNLMTQKETERLSHTI